MLRRKLAESLTIRIFLITVLLLLGAGTVTFGLIAWATPSTYTAVVNDDLTRQTDRLVEKLADTDLADSGLLLDDFIRATGADAVLAGADGSIVDTGSVLAGQTLYGAETSAVTSVALATAEGDSSVTWSACESGSSDAVTITMSEQAAIAAEVRFADQTEVYTLYVTPRIEAENLAVRALVQMAPWLLLALLFFSLLCALFYSRYITRPVVRLSNIAGKMARLDFGWECGDSRRDEIGELGRSLNEMARRLSTALKELEAANQALRGEVEREREQERKRMAFFSAASHELKTPVTILKGQLSGMLEGVDVYRNRDKYLLRSLQITGRMEHLIQEMLSISRMETGAVQKQTTAEILWNSGHSVFCPGSHRESPSTETPPCWKKLWATCFPTRSSTLPSGRKSGCAVRCGKAALSCTWKIPGYRSARRHCPACSRHFTGKKAPETAAQEAAGWGFIWSG